MPREELAAYVIMESVAEPVTVKNLEVIDKNSLFYLRFDTNLQDFNVTNRNNRIYMGNVMVPSLNADHILELENNGSWFGEAGHPVTEDIKRILTIDPKMISHRIIAHDVNTTRCRGTVETACTEYGKQMANLILQHMEPAFSLRALASVTKTPDKKQVIKTRAHVVTYDWVILPSHKVAYRDKSKPIQKVVQKIVDDGNVVNESIMTPVSESMIKDLIASESTNVKLISNICEIALEGMELSEDLKHVILRESGRTFIVPIEEKIKKDINSYMRYL